jgi:putative addiction module killer protein
LTVWDVIHSNDGSQARVAAALDRLERGNFSAAKGVGAGVLELRLDFGPGYRVYCGKDGEALVILLGGGTKKRQQEDILAAQALWREYKMRKREK